jgi:hypothetical protein
MDPITEATLKEFVTGHDLTGLEQDDQFEHLTAFITLRRHYNRTFDTADIVVGSGGDTGIDAVAILVNGALVTDVDATNDLIQRNGFIEASFVFVQAERSDSFDSSKAGSFGFGVENFFKPASLQPRNEKITAAAAFVSSLFERGALFKTKPSCRLYYVTTGTWKNDANVVARANGA